MLYAFSMTQILSIQHILQIFQQNRIIVFIFAKRDLFVLYSSGTDEI